MVCVRYVITCVILNRIVVSCSCWSQVEKAPSTFSPSDLASIGAMGLVAPCYTKLNLASIAYREGGKVWGDLHAYKLAAGFVDDYSSST